MSSFLLGLAKDSLVPVIISTLIAVWLDQHQTRKQNTKNLLSYIDGLELELLRFWASKGESVEDAYKIELTCKTGRIREKVEGLFTLNNLPEDLVLKLNIFEDKATGGEFSNQKRQAEEIGSPKIINLKQAIKELKDSITCNSSYLSYIKAWVLFYKKYLIAIIL